MAKPDLDDGYLRLAHELFAAVMCAGFNKWEMVVLREVFDQIYGPAKASTARLSPSEIAGRFGTFRETSMRAIRGLVGSSVLVKVGAMEYRFVKDYEAWRAGKGPRLSAAEVVYCLSCRRIKPSKSDVNNGAHVVSAGAHISTEAVNNGAHVCERGRSRGGAPALTPVSAGAHVNGVPPTPPIEERTRDKNLEEKGEGEKGPSPAPRPFGLEEKAVIAIACDRWGASNGDRVIGDFLKEYPASWVRAAMDEMFDALHGELQPKYMRSILRRYQREGGPRDRSAPKASPGPPKPKEYVTAKPDSVHPRFRTQS